MASLMENLLSVLEAEAGEYEALVELCKSKTPAIIEGNLAVMDDITAREQEAAGRIAQWDRQRQEITADVANVLGKNPATLTLTALAELLGQRPKEQAALAGLIDRLTAAVSALRLVNEQNGELIRTALEMTEFHLNVLQAMSSGPQTANYGREAAIVGGSGLRSQIFDAKQ